MNNNTKPQTSTKSPLLVYLMSFSMIAARLSPPKWHAKQRQDKPSVYRRADRRAGQRKWIDRRMNQSLTAFFSFFFLVCFTLLWLQFAGR